MEQEQNTPQQANSNPIYYDQQPSFYQKNKYLIKGILISILVLALLIPTFFISTLISERTNRMEEVKQEIAEKWSGEQMITAPVICIPYKSYTKTNDGKTVYNKNFAYFLPEKLNINGNLIPDERHRSIFKVIVYNSTLNIDGNFSALQFSKLNIASNDYIWNEAKILLGISDFKGIEEEVSLNWDNSKLLFNAGIPDRTMMQNGMQIPINISPAENKEHQFSLNLKLRGTERISFLPVGKSSKVTLNSPWKTPDFIGSFSPNSKLKDSGFMASWSVMDLNRSFGQELTSEENIEVNSAVFGVNLFQRINSYSQTSRTIKYAILIILLTFVIYFFIEIFQKKSAHPIQYILIGFALCVFYILLLSFSEYISFNYAYFIAALATVLLIALYSKSVFNSTKTAGIFGGFLSFLYLYIFSLIQLEDKALLFGSIGLFIILATIMYFSRKIDWYNSNK